MKFKAKINGNDFDVISIVGNDRVSDGYTFDIEIYINKQIDTIQIGQKIHVEDFYSGRIIYWESKNKDSYNNFYYRCRFSSSFEYFYQYNNYSIHHKSTTSEIIEKILSKHDVEHRFLSRKNKEYNYYVQYKESSKKAIQYLASNNGMFFYFKDDVIHFTDNNKTASEPIQINLVSTDQNINDLDLNYVNEWNSYQDSSPSSYRCYGFDIHNPDIHVYSETILNKSNIDSEQYYSDILTQNDCDDRSKNLRKKHHKKFATVTRNHNIHSGSRITLKNNNTEYLVLDVKHNYSNEKEYTNELTMISTGDELVPELPEMNKVYGIETATVVDNIGHNMVKVQFHWDAENYSMEIPVIQSLAGNGYGSFLVPRIGQRVCISFECGEPSRPFIIGSFYDGSHVPPHENISHYSGIRTKCLGSDKFNEVMISDESGKEKIKIYSCNDLEEDVENSKFLKIRNGNFDIRVEKGKTIIDTPEVIIRCDKILLQSRSVVFNTDGDVEINGNNVLINGSASTTIQSSLGLIIKGETVDIN